VGSLEGQDFRALGFRGIRLLRLNFLPIPIVRRKGDEDLAFRVRGNVGEAQTAFAFVHTPLA
jgi:hypothetical protein